MPFLFVFPNKSPSRVSFAPLWLYLKKLAFPIAQCVSLSSELNLTGTRTTKTHRVPELER